MSELETSSGDEQEPQQAEQQSAGELLKHAREAAGLHIAALAVSLKVPVKKLEALEANRLDLLPDAVFIRALASSVCRTLKIDATPVLARLPQTNAPKLTYQGVGINAPFRVPSDGPGPSVWSQLSRPTVLAGLVLLLGALVLIFMPAIKTSVNEVKTEAIDSRVAGAAISATNMTMTEAEKPQVPTLALQTNEPVVSTAPMTATEVATFVQAPSAATSSITASSTTAANPSTNLKTSVTATASTPIPISGSKVLSAGMSAGPPAGTSSPTFVVTPKPPAAADVIVFTAKGQSWVEATDARGQVVLSRVLNAGEVAGAAGALPLKVVIGRVNETQVQIRGKAFDLSAVAKDNVARFEVK